MKWVLTFSIICLTAASAYAELSKDEVKRLREGGAIVTELRESPDKGIPEDLWTRAECVLVIPSVKKAAFIVGGEYGSGVMSCRNKTSWTNPVFMQLAKGSWGLQIGAQQTAKPVLNIRRSSASDQTVVHGSGRWWGGSKKATALHCCVILF